jgi:hypothetical protein
MSRELITTDGKPSRGARNVDVALAQGRINPAQADEFRRLYDSKDYEVVTQALLALPPKRKVAPAKSFSERQWDEFARMTGVVKPWDVHGSYSRSVV